MKHLKFWSCLISNSTGNNQLKHPNRKICFESMFLEFTKWYGSKRLVLIKFYLSKRKLQEISARSNIAFARHFTLSFYLISPHNSSAGSNMIIFNQIGKLIHKFTVFHPNLKVYKVSCMSQRLKIVLFHFWGLDPVCIGQRMNFLAKTKMQPLDII